MAMSMSSFGFSHPVSLVHYPLGMSRREAIGCVAAFVFSGCATYDHALSQEEAALLLFRKGTLLLQVYLSHVLYPVGHPYP